MPATKFDKPVFPGAKLVETTVTVSNTSGSYSNTFTDERVATSMRAFQIEIEDPSIFNDKITITTANGSFTLACDEVAGETDVTIGFLKIADDPTEVTSTEFTVLNNRIGDLSSLTTTAKTSAVAAINENKQAIANKINTSDIANNLTTTAEGKVLDARQGKTLNEKIGQKLLYKQVTLTKEQLGTSWSPTSRTPGTASSLFGVAADKIVSITSRNGNFNPSANPVYGFFNTAFYVSATQNTTLGSSLTFEILYLP